MKKIYTTILFFIAFIGLMNFSFAQNITDKDVENFIIKIEKQSQDIVNNKKLTQKQKEEEYKKFTENIVDAKWVARFILANTWKELTPQQREEFEVLYKEYLLENYMPKLQDYNKNLEVKKIEKQRERVFMAYTTTKDNNNRDVNVAFRIIEKNGNLYITDIIPEGISFIGSQRTDINSAISQNGYENFIKQLKEKIKK